MALLEWKDDYRTGFRSIDFEHQNLIASINNIFENGSGDKEATLAALGEIHALVEAHFALEEKIMRDQHYAAYPPHKEDHERLLDDILNIMDEVEKVAGLDTETALRNRLGGWFSAHFATLDKDLHTMLGDH